MTTQRIISILIILSLLASPVLPAWAGTIGCGGGEEAEARTPQQDEHDAHDHAGHGHEGHDHGSHDHGTSHEHDADIKGHDHGSHDHGSHAHDHVASTVPPGVPSASAPIVCCSDSPFVLSGAISIATVPTSGQNHLILIPASNFLPSLSYLGASPAIKGLYKIGSSPPQAASDRYAYLRLSVFRI